MPRPKRPAPEGQKYCTKCDRTMPLDAFSRNASHTDGFANWCKDCMKGDHQRRRRENPDYFVGIGAKKRAKLRLAALLAYSPDGIPRCACCGESTIQFLAIDHIDGGGSAHRREVGETVRWLKRNNYPPGFQVLCHNCNMAKGFYGKCPHQG